MVLLQTDRRPTARWLAYVLCCSGRSLSRGITYDLPNRLQANVAGKASKYTRSRLSVTLAYTEPRKSKSVALKREAAIKSLRRAENEWLVAGTLSVGQYLRS